MSSAEQYRHQGEDMLSPYEQGQELIPWINAIPVRLSPDKDPILLRIKSINKTGLLSRNYILEDPESNTDYFAKHVTIRAGFEHNTRILRAASLREIKIAQQLSGQKGSPRLIDVVKKEDDYNNPKSPWYHKPIIVMEYIPHISKSKLEQRMFANPQWAIQTVFIPLLDILQQNHNQGIFHADLKPDQLLLTVTDRLTEELYLSDYGIAAIHQGGRTSSYLKDKLLKDPMTRGGTIPYIDPKVYSMNATIDLPNAKSDLYAVGMMLAKVFLQCNINELEKPLDGQPNTYVSKSPQEIADMLAQVHLPHKLKRIIRLALKHVYPSAEVMKKELQKALNDHKVAEWLKQNHEPYVTHIVQEPLHVLAPLPQRRRRWIF